MHFDSYHHILLKRSTLLLHTDTICILCSQLGSGTRSIMDSEETRADRFS